MPSFPLPFSSFFGIPHAPHLGILPFPPRQGTWVSPPCWFPPASSSINQWEKGKRRGEVEDQEKRSSIDRDPCFVQIQQAEFF